MKTAKTIPMLTAVTLCMALSGCGYEKEGTENPGVERESSEAGTENPGVEQESSEAGTEAPETEREKTETRRQKPESEREDCLMTFSELPGAYRQILLYVQEGFRKYHVEGEYQACLGPIHGAGAELWVDGVYMGTEEEADSYFFCDILLEGESGLWSERLAFTYDAEADWYSFSGQYEPLFAGDQFYAEQSDSSYVEEFLSACVYRTTVARDGEIGASARYDSENGPLEKDLFIDHAWNFRIREDNGLSWQIVPKIYCYWDDRLDVNIQIQYPWLEMDQGMEEMEAAVNERLREAFFYGYYRDEEENLLIPGEELYTDIERCYMITREDERYLSMRIYEYNSVRGANHPNEWETGITFDMRTGDVVGLRDVLGEDMAQGTLGDLLNGGAFRRLWTWMPEDGDWIEDLIEERGDDPLGAYESKFYLTDKGLGLITSLSRYYTCLEADYEKLGIEGVSFKNT